ncbi:hypothetical protein WA577_001615, partial [Blastocystis sp. JDR]
FAYVEELNLVELEKLERVVIGVNCFSKENSLGHFSLKNCRQVKELKMGRYSFRGYSACEIENNDSLEVIEMGELNKWSSNFYRSDCVLGNLPKLKSLLVGDNAFHCRSSVTFEDLPELTSIRLGEDAFCFGSERVFTVRG